MLTKLIHNKQPMYAVLDQYTIKKEIYPSFRCKTWFCIKK